MPGSAGGGGGHSGGGFSGGGHSGGFGGGGRGYFGGRYYHTPPPHYHAYPFWFFGPRYYYGYGTGCFSGLVGLLFAPLFILLFIGIFIFASIDGYDVTAIENYANDRYYEYFENDETFEDNLLLLFLVNKDASDSYYQLWAGDNIRPDVQEGLNDAFQNYYYRNSDNSARSLTRGYEHELGRNLSYAVSNMQNGAMVNQQIFYKDHSRDLSQAGVRDLSTYNFNVSQNLNEAVTEFTAETGIPLIVCIADLNDAQGEVVIGGNGMKLSTLIAIIVGVILLVVLIVVVVKTIRLNKAQKAQQSDGTYHGSQSGSSGRNDGHDYWS